MIAFILIWLLALDACHTQMPAEPPYTPPQPIIVAPERPTVEEQKPVPKNMTERKHLELLEGQINWMQKRIKNEKAEWNDR